MAGLVHDTHAAVAKLLQKFVLAEVFQGECLGFGAGFLRRGGCGFECDGEFAAGTESVAGLNGAAARANGVSVHMMVQCRADWFPARFTEFNFRQLVHLLPF